MLQLIKEKVIEVTKSFAPLIIVICVLQFTLVKAPAALFIQFVIGSLLVIVGLMFFFIGIDVGILPMGKYIGSELPQRRSFPLLIGVAFSFGFATTIAEPDVLVLARQVDVISEGLISRGAILYITAIGVGIYVVIAMLRIVLGLRMDYLLIASYLIIMILSFFTPVELVPLAFDAGSVTTGALTAPVIIAIALGLSSTLADRSALSDGFGLLGFASIGPIIAVMFVGILLK